MDRHLFNRNLYVLFQSIKLIYLDHRDHVERNVMSSSVLNFHEINKYGIRVSHGLLN